MRSIFLLTTIGLVGCLDSFKDSDEDGLSNKEEAEFGSDPENADSDGDGLSDLEEFDMDLDPNSEDSDGDGYLDSWEVAEGSDPADADDRIYVGYWPYNPDKDAYNAPTSIDDTDDNIGSQLVRIPLMDQFGDTVDLYDFTGQGKYIAIDISAIWCGPCNQLARAIANGNPNAGWGSAPEKVHNGELYWMTILGENESGRTPTLSDLEAWYDRYTDDKVPVFADSDAGDYVDLLLGSGWPTIVLFDENLNLVQGPTNADHYAALSAIEDL